MPPCERTATAPRSEFGKATSQFRATDSVADRVHGFTRAKDQHLEAVVVQVFYDSPHAAKEDVFVMPSDHEADPPPIVHSAARRRWLVGETRFAESRELLLQPALVLPMVGER